MLVTCYRTIFAACVAVNNNNISDDDDDDDTKYRSILWSQRDVIFILKACREKYYMLTLTLLYEIL